jgi:hypothetical protein
MLVLGMVLKEVTLWGIAARSGVAACFCHALTDAVQAPHL